METFVSFLLLAIIAQGTFQFLRNSNTQLSRDARRLQAQIALESVADTVSTMAPGDLLNFVNGSPINGAASTAWLAQWNAPPGLTGMNVQVRKWGPTPAVTEIIGPLPVAANITDYDLEVTVSASFVRIENQPAETLTLVKKVMHQ